MTHCSSEKLAFSDLLIGVSATETMVVSTSSMKVATATIASVQRLREAGTSSSSSAGRSTICRMLMISGGGLRTPVSASSGATTSSAALPSSIPSPGLSCSGSRQLHPVAAPPLLALQDAAAVEEGAVRRPEVLDRHVPVGRRHTRVPPGDLRVVEGHGAFRVAPQQAASLDDERRRRGGTARDPQLAGERWPRGGRVRTGEPGGLVI